MERVTRDNLRASKPLTKVAATHLQLKLIEA